jgi:hypothetical protein
MAPENALAQNNPAAGGVENAVSRCSSKAHELARNDQGGQDDRS